MNSLSDDMRNAFKATLGAKLRDKYFEYHNRVAHRNDYLRDVHDASIWLIEQGASKGVVDIVLAECLNATNACSLSSASVSEHRHAGKAVADADAGRLAYLGFETADDFAGTGLNGPWKQVRNAKNAYARGQATAKQTEPKQEKKVSMRAKLIKLEATIIALKVMVEDMECTLAKLLED